MPRPWRALLLSVGVALWALGGAVAWADVDYLEEQPSQIVGGELCRLGSDVPFPNAALLVFSDHPERVTQSGLLCRGGLPVLRAVRLQLYHQGGRQEPLYLVLRLHNSGRERAVVSLASGVGHGPADNYFQAGHDNAKLFLHNLLEASQGYRFVLEPGEWRTIWREKLPQEDVVSGTFQLFLGRGSGVEYALFASDAAQGPWLYNLLSNEKDVHARGYYPVAERVTQQTVEVGGWQKERDSHYWAIGATRQPNAFSGPELKGDYGVLYRWELTLRNSSDTPKELEFALNPRGGKATASFPVYMWGETQPWSLWEREDELEAFQWHSLDELTLAPHSERHCTIYTMPEGASNYPVRLVVRPL